MKATDDQGQKTLSTFRKISDSAKGMFRGVGTGIMQGIGQGIWGTITLQRRSFCRKPCRTSPIQSQLQPNLALLYWLQVQP